MFEIVRRSELAALTCAAPALLGGLLVGTCQVVFACVVRYCNHKGQHISCSLYANSQTASAWPQKSVPSYLSPQRSMLDAITDNYNFCYRLMEVTAGLAPTGSGMGGVRHV